MEGPIRYIYAGRLVTEKGFDQIISLITHFSERGNEPNIHIDIYGDGELVDQIPQASFVTYHGRLPKEELLDVRGTYHYTLMPSVFLETFGLTALDSLSRGVPVIGPRKGGLAQFVDESLTASSSDELIQLVEGLSSSFSDESWQHLSQNCLEVAKNYTRESRLTRFRDYFGQDRGSILLISDYIVDIGGIESYLLEIKKILEQAGYEVVLAGSVIPRNQSSRMKHIWKTLCNFMQHRHIQKAIDTHSPDLIWRHSVHRQIGWYPIWKQRHTTTPQWVMYHDFGLIHPYPSQVTDEHQLYYPLSLSGFLHAAGKATGVRKILLISKRYLINTIRKLLAHKMHYHFVPSTYMEPLFQYHYLGKVQNIHTFPHFI